MMISTIQDIEMLWSEHDIVLAYFSHDKCSVCKVLFPKIKGLIERDFPLTMLSYCNIEYAPELAAKLSVFTVPTLVIYVQGKEYVRYSRNMGLDQIARSIARPYHLLLKDETSHEDEFTQRND